ncbi:pseudouridylate synthase RPUSD2-like [Porites lutea]|uniref:pseudouridylate synthase RPUSD2-like n=1 Tax=Porites lutea TaxID=51062 RepID=UPI003CC5A676
MADSGQSKRAVKRKAKLEARKQKQKQPKLESNRKPGFDQNLLEETTCYVKNGLRHVHPYYFTFTTYCKGRWVGRTLMDVFKEEFRSETEEYYEKAIKAGKITVNGGVAFQDTMLKDNDIICNKVHRHEPPVVGDPFEIVELNESMVVLNKPSSIPVHPCGRYRHNTVVFILGKEHGLANLFTIHRIDRLTSGILIFARTLSKAQELERQVRDREIVKEYVCRVQGEFPSEIVDCQEPIMVESHKIGICRVSANGKPCRTVFTRIHFNGKSSVVKCVPYTGRMHQIRVHLQWLGYPIINDPIYNHTAWGPHRGRGGVSVELVKKVMSELTEKLDRNKTDAIARMASQEKDSGTLSSDSEENSNCNQYHDKDCSECHIIRSDPTRSELTMFLHALSYKGPNWEFETRLPSWAKEEWSEECTTS